MCLLVASALPRSINNVLIPSPFLILTSRCVARTLPNDHPNKLVALKIQKSASQYAEAALDEIELLNELRNKAKGDNCCGGDLVVRLHDSFVTYGPNGKHVCLVFETMGTNLLTLIKKYKYVVSHIGLFKLLD